MTHLGTQLRIGDNLNLALIYNCVKLILNSCVQNLTDVLCTEACVKSVLAYTDTDHITLTGMHNTLDAVQVVMELTLEYRLKVSLHALSGNLYHVADAMLAAYLELVEVRSDYFDLVILNLRRILCLNQLEAVHTGTVELYLHIAAADNLALECGCEGNRDIDLGNLNLNISCFNRSSVELGYVLLNDQALRYTEDVLGLVGNYRETKSDCACTASYDNIIQRLERIYERRYTVHGVLHQRACVARCYVTEDQSCTKRYRYNVDYCGYVLTKRYDTYGVAHVQACLYALIDNAAYQSNQTALCLIALNQLYCFFCRRSASQDNSYARDIAGYKGYTQLTDDSVCQMSVAGLLVRLCAVHVLQYLDELCAQSCCNTAHECVVQSLLSGHQSFYNSQSCLQFFQVGNLASCYGIVAGKAVCSVREGYCRIFSVLCDCAVDSSLGQSVNCVVAAEYSIK